MKDHKPDKTIWHEMEGPVIGGREHYQEKSYGGFDHREPFAWAEDAAGARSGENEQAGEKENEG